MIRKRASMLVLGILLVLGACSPTTDEGPDLTKPPEKENPGEKVENPETEMDTNPEVSEQTSEEILNEVKAAIKTDVEVKLPEDVLTSEGYLTAATSSDANKYEVNFYVTNVPVAVNDPLLQDAHPYMIVNGTKFDSADEARAKINYEPLVDEAQKTDLGYGITGYMDTGAGSVFLTWHEGSWSFSTRNHNDANGSEEMIALAKQIVSKLESQLLPTPHDTGAGVFDMNSNGAAANSIIWQDGETVYEIFTGDPLLLIDTITGYMGQ